MTESVSPTLLKNAFPAVSIALPLHPGFPEMKEDKVRIKKIVADAHEQLNLKFGKEVSDGMTQRIQSILSNAGNLHLKKSLFIFLSHETERVFSINVPVEEKIIVDDTFEIRDLLYAAQHDVRYMLVSITRNRVKTFLFDLMHVTELDLPYMPEGVRDVENEHSFPGRDYRDSNEHRDVNTKNYLHVIDVELKKFVTESGYPVVIMGESKLLGSYKKQTSIANSIIGYVTGNFEHASMTVIKKEVKPVVNGYYQKKQQHIIDMLEQASGINHFASGIEDVWRAAAEGRGRMLIVEEDFRVRARRGTDEFTILPLEEKNNLNPHSILEDAVDDVIQLMLSKGGDVWFTEEGVLQKYNSIALITRY